MTEKHQKGRGPGRPVKPAAPGTRVSLGLKVTPETKAKLDAAARASGRTQSQEAEFRLERSFEREQLLEDALTLKFGRVGAGILLTLALTMDRAGRSYLIDKAWRDVPKGAGIEDVDPARWERVLSMHWADDPSSREVGMISMLGLFALLPRLSMKPNELVPSVYQTIQVLRSLRMNGLPPTSGGFRKDIETIRSLMSPDMIERPESSIDEDIRRVLRDLADLLGRVADAMPKVVKP